MKTHAQLTRAQRLAKVEGSRRDDVCLVMENILDDKNVSMMLRTAEALGVNRVCVIHQKGKKPKVQKGVTSGAYKWLKVKYYVSTKSCFSALKKQGFKLVGALVNPEVKVLWEQKFTGKIAVVVGNESKGLTEMAQSLMDQTIYLPMFGLTESLNVSIAASIFLYEIVRDKEKS